MTKRKGLRASIILLAVVEVAVLSQVRIPATRLRIVYKDTNQPVEWVKVEIEGWQKWASRAERKAYEENVGAMASMKTVLGGTRFLHADDGWITIPAVTGVKMDRFAIDLRPAACGVVVYKNNEEKEYASTFTGKSLPKFLSLPEANRVLEAELAPQCYLPPGTQQPSYEEARYFLAAYEILLSQWPHLSWATDCYGVKEETPPYYKGYYWTTVDDYLTRIFTYVEPPSSYKLYYFGNSTPLTDAQRADLLERIRSLFCTDIEAKLRLWGDTSMPLQALFRESQLFQHCWESLHCENIDAEGRLVDRSKPPGGPSVPAQEKHTAPATPTPSAASPPQSPPTEAPDKH
jgi:hypothetical protein